MYSPTNLNPFPNKPWFSCVCSTSHLKTLWEKEKLLVTSNFSFPTVFFTHLENFPQFSSNLELSSEDSLNLEELSNLPFGKGLRHSLAHSPEFFYWLTFSQTANFELFQSDRVCRQSIFNLMKMAESYPNR